MTHSVKALFARTVRKAKACVLATYVPVHSLHSTVQYNKVNTVVPAIPIKIKSNRIPVAIKTSVVTTNAIINVITTVKIIAKSVAVVVLNVVQIKITRIAAKTVAIVPVINLVRATANVRQMLPIMRVPRRVPPITRIRIRQTLPIMPVLHLRTKL